MVYRVLELTAILQHCNIATLQPTTHTIATTHNKCMYLTLTTIYTTKLVTKQIKKKEKMDNQSRETLRMVEQNELITLIIQGAGAGTFFSENNTDYSRLGSSIAENTNLEHLDVSMNGLVSRSGDDNVCYPTLEVSNDAFFNGLKCNSSISKVTLRCGGATLVGGVFHEILKAYQENNEHITYLEIRMPDIQNGGEQVIAETMRRCTNIQELDINSIALGGFDINSMTRRQLLQPIAEAIRGHSSLEKLSLDNCQVGNQCEVLATLLEDPNSNLQSLNLRSNSINFEGANVIVNSLINNTKLRKLYLSVAPIYRNGAAGLFSKLICNTSNINSLHSSNHSLEKVSFESYSNADLNCCVEMNVYANKGHVATRKILHYHPNIDISPLYNLDVEEDDEQNLKGLPYVVSWFERADEAVESYSGWKNEIERRKLSSIYQFAQAMPLLFVPTSQVAKRSDTLLNSFV